MLHVFLSHCKAGVESNPNCNLQRERGAHVVKDPYASQYYTEQKIVLLVVHF